VAKHDNLPLPVPPKENTSQLPASDAEKHENTASLESKHGSFSLSMPSDERDLKKHRLATISVQESCLISEEIRKSAAAALIRGPPATRHFGGNRGGLYLDPGSSNVGNICICGSEKTVIFSPGASSPGKTYPIGASGAIISDQVNDTEYLCCFLATDKRIVVFDLKSKIVVVELQMTTKLNFWRFLPPATHGDTLVFMLITPIGGFHWMPLEESPRPRQIWRRGRDLQGKKIVSYEEGGSNGKVGPDRRSTMALVMTSTAASGDPVEAWCLSLSSGFSPFCASQDVIGAALFNASTSKMDTVEPNVVLVTPGDRGNNAKVVICKLKTNHDTHRIEIDEIVAQVEISQFPEVSVAAPAMAMGEAAPAFCLCCQNFVVVILRNKGFFVAYQFEDNDLYLIDEKNFGRYVVDAAIKTHQESDEIDVVLLLCDSESVKDGRIVTITISK